MLHFIRHAESEANLLNEFSNGLNKHPLTEKGRQQAVDLACRLKGLPITACYSSPTLRAVQTAQILSNALGCEYHLTDALREFDVGVLEGKSDDASWQMFFQLWEAWFVRGEWEQRIEAGESFLDIRQRFVPFIEGLVQQYGSTSAHLLLVGHGGTFRCMLPLVLCNLDFSFAYQHNLANTATVSAEITPDGLVCRQWGDIKLPFTD